MTVTEVKKRVVVERREIDGERAYPCYTVRAAFNRPRTEAHADYTAPHWQVEGRPDLFRDTATMHAMERERMSEARTAEVVESLVTDYLAKHPDAVPVGDGYAEMTHWETWCLTWFSHFTFPEGRSDAELIASFSAYVSRHAWYQKDYPMARDDDEYAICLMGAEDHWRWRNGDGDHANPICRCDGCQKHGVVRVSH